MNSSPKRFLIVGFVVLISLLAGGFYFLFGQGRFGASQPLPVATYLENPENLRGNRYLLDAWIEGQLVWREETGRIMEVRPAEESANVAVFVPASLNQNLYVGQRYRMDVRIRNGGLIYVQDLEKY